MVFLSLVGNAQISEVLTFTTANQLSDDSSFYLDHIYQGKYYYIAATGTNHSFLYAFDPANNVITQVADVTSNYKLNSPTNFVTSSWAFQQSGNYLYFSTSTVVSASAGVEMELWRTDGTAAGTVKLMSYQNGANTIMMNHWWKPSGNSKSDYTLNGEMIFVASPTPGTKQYWKTDGTVAGTQMIKNFVTTGTSFQNTFLLGKLGSNIIFTNINNYQYEIWKTDGTTAGTVPITDASGNIEKLNGVLGMMSGRFFYIRSTDFTNPAASTVYSTDGITVQTHPQLPGNPLSSSNATMEDGVGGLYYFDRTSSSPVKRSLYYTTPNTANAALLADFPAGHDYSLIWANKNGALLNKISGNNVIGQVFVEKNGSQHILDNASSGVSVIEYKNTLYSGQKLINDTPQYGSELFRIDTHNSYFVKDIYPGTIVFNGITYANSSGPKNFFVLNDKLYFAASDPAKKLFSLNGDFTFNNSQGNNLWSAATNWNSNLFPILTDNAVIPTGFTPTIDGAAFANNLDISSPLDLSAGSLNLGENLNIGAKITLNNNNLNLKGPSSQITNGNSTNYIVTNGTGTVKVENLNSARGTVNLPIGTATNYNPLSIANTGTSDTFSARVSEGIANTTNGAVNATWEISEGTAGGSNVSLTLGWNTSQQNAVFDSVTAKVGHYLNGNWAEENSGSVLNNNITATGISSFSPFAVMNFGALATSDFSKSKVSVYPNPFNENLNISTENGGVVHFYDLSGKLVSTSVLMKGTNSLNKSSLAKGVYIYQIRNTIGEILSSGKVIKK